MQKQQELGLDIYFDNTDGLWHFRDEQLFLATSGYVSNQAIDIDKDNKWFDHLSSNDGEHLIKQYESLVNLGTATPTKSSVATDDLKLGAWGLR